LREDDDGKKRWDARTKENTTLWPGWVIAYVRRTKRAVEGDYQLS
jgi:hypothetical protein